MCIFESGVGGQASLVGVVGFPLDFAEGLRVFAGVR